MSLKHSTMIKIAGLCGLLTPIILILVVILSVYFAPWFSWTENWLSEMAGSLGERPIWAARGLSSLTWNLGLVIAGLIGILFAISIQKSRIFKTNWSYLTIFVLFLDMSALCGIGVFPLTVGSIHVLNAIVFFALIPILLFVSGYELFILFGKKWWWITIMLFFISISSIFVYILTGARAIAEIIAIGSLFIFLIIFSFKLLKISFSSEKKYLKNIALKN